MTTSVTTKKSTAFYSCRLHYCKPEKYSTVRPHDVIIGNARSAKSIRRPGSSRTTLVSLIVHTMALWIAVFLTMGIPQVALAAVFAIVITGILQPIMRHCHYTGIHKLGTSRAVTLRNTFPLPAVLIGILFLGEPITPLGVAGTVS